MLRETKKRFSLEEYFALERVAECKNEYFGGEFFEMPSENTDHSKIAVNLTTEFGQHLAHRPCDVFNSDMRLLVERVGLYTYPDVMIVCGKIEFAPKRDDVITNPTVIVEVLSESTRAYDRGQKFEFYKQIPTLQEYVLAESGKSRVECHRRGKGNRWNAETTEGLDAIVRIESVGCEIPMRRIYNKVSWV